LDKLMQKEGPFP